MSDSEQDGGDLPKKLSAPARRALVAAGCVRLAQVAAYSEAELLALHGMGPNAIAKLREALHAAGLSFAGEQGPT